MELTAKEKAKELVDTYRPLFFGSVAYKSLSKKCAIIAADEVLMEIRRIYDIYTEENIIRKYKYWEQVKTEINNL